MVHAKDRMLSISIEHGCKEVTVTAFPKDRDALPDDILQILFYYSNKSPVPFWSKASACCVVL